METVNKTRYATQDELVDSAQARLDAAIEHGTTTIEMKSGYGLQLEGELKILRVIRQLKRSNPCKIMTSFLGAHAIPPYLSETDYARTVIDQMIPRVASEKLADFCDVFCEEGAFNSDSSKKILLAAKDLKLRPKIHADQFTNSSGAKVANDVNAVSADHLVHSSLPDLERMIKTSVVPVVLPASSFSLLSNEYAPAREMLEANLPLALGSDFSPSNWILGMLTVAGIAARTLRMKSEEIIRGITINAAKALGLDRRVGSLKPGKSADIVILQEPTYRRIGYTLGEGAVDKVLIDGKEIVRDGKRIR